MATSTSIPADLRERLEAEIGPLDPMSEVLVGRLLQMRSAEDFYDAERAVHEAMRLRGDTITSAVLRHRTDSPEHVDRARRAVQAQARASGSRLESNGRRKTKVRLLGGSVVELKTLRLHPPTELHKGRPRKVGQRGPAGTGVYPALEEIGVVGWATPALRIEVAREVAESNSVSVARSSLKERGLDVEHKTALRLTYLTAELALEARDLKFQALTEGAKPSGELAGKHVIACLDGGRVRLRVNPTAGRRRASGHRRYDAPWREPKLLTIYVVGEDGRRDRRHRSVIDGTMGDADAVVALLVGHLRLLGAHEAQRLTLLGDGAPWIWGRAEQIRKAVGVAANRFAAVVDWYHAMEHVHAVAALNKGWSDLARKAWVSRVERQLYEGRLDEVMREIREQAVGRRAAEVKTELAYFEDNRDRMAYAAFRAEGIPTGSGAVESAIRRVVNLRVKGNSIFWLEEHAEALIHLRAHLKSDRWDDFVRATLRRPAARPLRNAA
jgi:hypothetical protein